MIKIKILLFVFLLSVISLCADEKTTAHFLESLEKSYQLNQTKIHLDYEVDSMKQNINYLVYPHLQEYILNANELFIDDENQADSNLKTYLRKYSVLDIFLFGVNLVLSDMQKEQVQDQQIKEVIYRLKKNHLTALQHLVFNTKNLEELQFVSKHIETFLTFSFNNNSLNTCEAIANFRKESLLFRFIIFSEEEYVKRAYTQEEINQLLSDTLIKEADRNHDTMKLIEKKVYQQYRKENDDFLLQIKANFDNFTFLKGYLKKLNQKNEQMKKLETIFETEPYDLDKLINLYSDQFANQFILYSVNIFSDLVLIYQKFKTIEQKCS